MTGERTYGADEVPHGEAERGCHGCGGRAESTQEEKGMMPSSVLLPPITGTCSPDGLWRSARSTRTAAGLGHF